MSRWDINQTTNILTEDKPFENGNTNLTFIKTICRAFLEFHILRSEQKGRDFAEGIFKSIFLNENIYNWSQISLNVSRWCQLVRNCSSNALSVDSITVFLCANFLAIGQLGHKVWVTRFEFRPDSCVATSPCWPRHTCIVTHLPWTKWPPIHRRHFQMYFLEWKCMDFD